MAKVTHSRELLDKLDVIGRALRRASSELPFGGIQLVLCGDFLQLPPVGIDERPSVPPFFQSSRSVLATTAEGVRRSEGSPRDACNMATCGNLATCAI